MKTIFDLVRKEKECKDIVIFDGQIVHVKKYDMSIDSSKFDNIILISEDGKYNYYLGWYNDSCRLDSTYILYEEK